MPGEIPTINTNVARQASAIDTAAQLAKGLGLSEKATQAVKEVAAPQRLPNQLDTLRRAGRQKLGCF